MMLRLTWDEFIDFAKRGIREDMPKVFLNAPTFIQDFGNHNGGENQIYDLPHFVHIELGAK